MCIRDRYYSKTKVYGNYNSKGVSVNVPKPVVPGQPKLKKATAESYDRVKLTWNKASNATAYRIYYRTCLLYTSRCRSTLGMIIR